MLRLNPEMYRNASFHRPCAPPKIKSYESILEKGFIDPNSEGGYPRNWKCDCYSRQRGFVCLFDLRNIQTERNLLTISLFSGPKKTI